MLGYKQRSVLCLYLYTVNQFLFALVCFSALLAVTRFLFSFNWWKLGAQPVKCSWNQIKFKKRVTKKPRGGKKEKRKDIWERARQRAHPKALNNLEKQREDKTKEQEKNTSSLTQRNTPQISQTSSHSLILFLSFSLQKTSLAAIFISSVSPLKNNRMVDMTSQFCSSSLYSFTCALYFFLLISVARLELLSNELHENETESETQ